MLFNLHKYNADYERLRTTLKYLESDTAINKRKETTDNFYRLFLYAFLFNCRIPMCYSDS